MTDTRRSSVGSRRGIGTTTAGAPLGECPVASRAGVNPGASAVPALRAELLSRGRGVAARRTRRRQTRPALHAELGAGHVVGATVRTARRSSGAHPGGKSTREEPAVTGITPGQRVELGVGHRADRLADALLDAEAAVSDPAERSELGAPARNLVYVHGSRPQLANAARDRAPVERTDRARQGVARGVGGRDRLVEVAHADDRSTGPSRRNVVEHRRLQQRAARYRSRRIDAPCRARLGTPLDTPATSGEARRGGGPRTIRPAGAPPRAAARQPERAERRALGGLEHDRRAGRDRRRELVRDLVQRVVERVIAATRRGRERVRAAGAAVRRDVARERLAVVAQRLDRGEAEHVDGARHLVAGVLRRPDRAIRATRAPIADRSSTR